MWLCPVNMDNRKQFIVDSIIKVLSNSALAFADGGNLAQRIGSDSALEKFLDDTPVLLSARSVKDSSGQLILKLANEVSNEGESEQEVSIIKTTPGRLPDSGFESKVIISTGSKSPILSFYLTLRNVYTPRLIGYDKSLLLVVRRIFLVVARKPLFQLYLEDLYYVYFNFFLCSGSFLSFFLIH